jgi:hypothetical protein
MHLFVNNMADPDISDTVAECMSAFMRVAAPRASGVEMTLL